MNRVRSGFQKAADGGPETIDNASIKVLLESVLRQVDGFVIKKNTWKIWQNGELPN